MSRTPRTLADCRFVSGHAIAHISQPTRTDRVLGVVLAVVLGIIAACWLLHELAKGY